MKSVIAWIKANPVSLVSILIVLLAIGVLVVIPMGWGGALTEKVTARDGEYKAMDRFMRQSVEMPPTLPDDPPRVYSNITINPAVIDRRRQANEQINQQYQDTYEYAVARNIGPDREQGGVQSRRFLLTGLFPIEQTSSSQRFLARDAYLAAFPDMLREFSPEAPGPRLDAGVPPTQERINGSLMEVEQEFNASQQVTGGTLSEDDAGALQKQKTDRLMEILRERAETIHVYAETDPASQAFPFQIGAWGYGEEFPEPQEIWEGQLELWIQQDIARAIAIANNVDGSRRRVIEQEGETLEEAHPASVIDAPVKRLIRVEVLPGYVGFHTAGGVASPTGGGASAMQQGGSYPAPAGGMTGSPDERQSDNFYVGPSGRVSNAVYDVRHARVEAIVDYQQLPALFEAFSRVSFMTVLDCQIKDVDEYDALSEGYFYGVGDAVQITMVIETIWLREWTEGLMPERTKQYLGLLEPPADEAATPDVNYQDYYGGYNATPPGMPQ